MLQSSEGGSSLHEDEPTGAAATAVITNGGPSPHAGGPNSLELIKASELYPKPNMKVRLAQNDISSTEKRSTLFALLRLLI